MVLPVRKVVATVIRVTRVYDYAPGGAGESYLVDRLWPRGLRRSAVPLDGWLPDVAPSTQLRQWFGHEAARWPEFRRRYAAELEAHSQAWQPLLDAASRGELTLLYSSRDREHNNAVVLRDYLQAQLDAREQPGPG